MPTRVDYIIVGQGIAGSCLTIQLLQRGCTVRVYDVPSENRATRIAAGLFNPVTGKVMVKTWMADVLFPYLDEFYRNAEQFVQAKFYHPMPLFRPFVSIAEQNEWMAQSGEPGWANFMESVLTTPSLDPGLHHPYGGLMLRQCGYVDTAVFTEGLRALLMRRESWIGEHFQEDELELLDDGVRYRDVEARRVIFCQGVHANTSRFFGWLPIRPLKGETLTIKPSTEPAIIYNRGVYLVPHLWKVGATYSNQDKLGAITEAGRKELVTKLDELIKFPYEIINQEWGMRPTTPDRRPVVGCHPGHPQLVAFNGLGTKGISLAPYFSGVLATWLENGPGPGVEVDLNRYKSLYWESA
jgi:glycine oxidase